MGRGKNFLFGLILIAIAVNSYIKYIDISNLFYGIILIVVGFLTFATGMGSRTISYNVATQSEASTATRKVKHLFIGIVVLVIGAILLLTSLGFTIPFSEYSMILIGIFGLILLLSK